MNECMVSFDVVSLFTSVPINEVKIFIFDLLSKDTKFTVQDIVLCLELCLILQYFRSRTLCIGKFLGLRWDVASLLWSLLMAYVAKTAINTFHTPPTLWVRFVNDTSNALVSESFMII